MAHYAFLDENNIVTEVIVGKDEDELLDGLTPEEWYGNFRGQRCIRTSYNNNIRKNFAGIGYIYDEDLDAFIPPKPYESWTVDEELCNWVPPVACPSEQVTDYKYVWDEASLSWVSIQIK
jgi:hypothetical protein